MEINEITMSPLKIAGISVRTNNADESDPSKAKIMGLYNKFFGENIEEQIPNKINEDYFMGVYTDYESDVNGEYTLLIAKEVSGFEKIPDELQTKEITESKYLKFANEGKMPGVVIETWKYIWEYFSQNDKYERAYTTDFEKYNKAVTNKVEIFISIK